MENKIKALFLQYSQYSLFPQPQWEKAQNVKSYRAIKSNNCTKNHLGIWKWAGNNEKPMDLGFTPQPHYHLHKAK